MATQLIPQLSFPAHFAIELPLSKSIVARNLLLEYAYHRPLQQYATAVKGDFSCEDISVLYEALVTLQANRGATKSDIVHLYSGESGTAYRFLLVTALFEPHPTALHYAPRLKERIQSKDFLPFQKLGAKIEHRPELCQTLITPAPLRPGSVCSGDWDSSQYLSALLLTQPLHTVPLQINLDSTAPSYSYIRLTEAVMHSKEQHTTSTLLERDWSAASFWYLLMSLHPEIQSITFPDLQHDSAQPDVALNSFFQAFGLQFSPKGKLTRHDSANTSTDLHIDLTQNLDLFSPLLSAAVLHDRPIQITGIQNLRIKESDRIQSTLDNLQAIGANDFQVESNRLIWHPNQERRLQESVPRGTSQSIPDLDAYGDHRIAMTMATIATSLPYGAHLSGIESIQKSYPQFLSQLLGLGRPYNKNITI